MKPFLRFIWQPIDWRLGTKTGIAPFQTLLYGITECSICMRELDINTKAYLDNDIQAIKSEAKAAQSSEKFFINDLKLLCEECYIIKAKKLWINKAMAMKRMGLPMTTRTTITLTCHRCIVAGKEGEIEA